MDKYVKDGVKKLFSLTRTKIRLAEEAETFEVKPAPLPVVKLFSNQEVVNVAECKVLWQELKEGMDYDNDMNVASTVLQLCDIIECVKHRFEHPDYMPLLTEEELSMLEGECRKNDRSLNVLLMTTEPLSGVYFGEDPPEGVRHYSRVISGIAPFLRFAYNSNYLSEDVKLRNMRVHYGTRTLLGNAVNFALKVLSDLP
ncbi:MAG: hypothetical protein V1744_08230 [Candidatus Altiarchaeota archaeon]